MSKRHDIYEEWAIRQLDPIIELSIKNRDALPGQVVSLVKEAQRIMRKRRRG